MKDKAVYGKSLIEKIEDVNLQYEIDDLKRIENYQKGKLVVTLNLLIATMGVALAASAGSTAKSAARSSRSF